MLRAPLRVSVLFVATAVAVAGCGVRGSLEAPRAEGAPAQSTSTAAAESGQGKKQGEAPKPHQGFVLDRLLQ